MNRCTLICIILIIFVYSACHADDTTSDVGTRIAIEVMRNNKSSNTPIIGALEYTASSIKIVFFNNASIHKDEKKFGINSTCYEIEEKKPISKGIYSIKATNEFGTTVTGTIDCRDIFNSKINLVNLQSGSVITNISKNGEKWHRENIPNIMLGYGH